MTVIKSNTLAINGSELLRLSCLRRDHYLNGQLLAHQVDVVHYDIGQSDHSHLNVVVLLPSCCYPLSVSVIFAFRHRSQLVSSWALLAFWKSIFYTSNGSSSLRRVLSYLKRLVYRIDVLQMHDFLFRFALSLAFW